MRLRWKMVQIPLTHAAGRVRPFCAFDESAGSGALALPAGWVVRFPAFAGISGVARKQAAPVRSARISRGAGDSGSLSCVRTSGSRQFRFAQPRISGERVAPVRSARIFRGADGSDSLSPNLLGSGQLTVRSAANLLGAGGSGSLSLNFPGAGVSRFTQPEFPGSRRLRLTYPRISRKRAVAAADFSAMPSKSPASIMALVTIQLPPTA